MAVELADAYISIVPSGRGLQQNIASQLSGAGFQQQGARAGSDAADGFGSKFSLGIGKIAALAGTAVAAIGVTSFLKDSVSAGSDLNETLSKSAAIFGDQAPAIEKWGDTAAKSLGLSKAAALASAAGFGDMFTQLGFTGDAAASMSKDVVQTAADLGSFNNLDTNDVLDRLSGAFRGEYDSLQAVIPNISAARVETEALAMTGKKAAKELTAQEKAAAVLAIVHKDGAKSAGDFAKTSNGLANQQKILSASFEDVKAKVGTALLPMLTKLGTFLIDNVVPTVSRLTTELTDRFGPGVQQVGGWVQSNLVPALMQLWSWVQEHIIPAVTNLSDKIKSGLVSAFETIKGKLDENRPQLEQLWSWLVTIAGYITDYVVPVFAIYLRTALELAGKYIGFVIDFIGGLVFAAQGMASGISTAVDTVKGAFTTAKDWVGEKVAEIVAFVKDMPQKVADAVTNVAAFIAAPFITAYTTVKEWVDKIVAEARRIKNAVTGQVSASDILDIPPGMVGNNAQGTSNWRGGLTWVGELGPELVNLNRGAQVFSNHDSVQMANGGHSNGASNNFTIVEASSPQATAQSVARRLAMVAA